MREFTFFVIAVVIANPALAASGPFFSFANTDFVVLIAFILFLSVIFYFRIPSRLLGMLDNRAQSIQEDIDEAKRLRDDAQQLLSNCEKKQKEMKVQAEKIITEAKREAEILKEQAEQELEKTIFRRVASAEERISLARSVVIREVRNEAIILAVAVARDIIQQEITEKSARDLIQLAIDETEIKLH
ncbi:MAG: ATP F0F1 synthase subunit B [Aestuariivita sp.]|nr:ATP F0F1 synthase subunit B [Aestuariivita sp.]